MALTNLGERQGSPMWVRRATAGSLRRLLTLAGLGVAAWLCGGAAAAVAAELPDDPSLLPVVDSVEEEPVEEPAAEEAASGAASGSHTGGSSAGDVVRAVGDEVRSVVKHSATQDSPGHEPTAESPEEPIEEPVEEPAAEEAASGAASGSHTGGSSAGDVVRAVGDEARSVVEHSATVGSAQNTVTTLSTHLREQTSESLADTGEVLDRATQPVTQHTTRDSAADSPDSLAKLGTNVRDVISKVSGLRDTHSVQLGSGSNYEDSTERATFAEASPLADIVTESGDDLVSAASSNRELMQGQALPERVATAVGVPATGQQQEAVGTPEAGPDTPGHNSADVDSASAVSAPESTATGSTSAQAPVSAVAADLGVRQAALPRATALMDAPDGPRFIVPGASTDPFFSPD